MRHDGILSVLFCVYQYDECPAHHDEVRVCLTDMDESKPDKHEASEADE